MAKVIVWRGKPMLYLKFRQLAVNTPFRFASEATHPFMPSPHGPWIKTGPRTYMHAVKADPHTYRVGSINVYTMSGPGLYDA